jgi:hypothetical protein
VPKKLIAGMLIVALILIFLVLVQSVENKALNSDSLEADFSYRSDCLIIGSGCSLPVLDEFDMSIEVKPKVVEALDRFHVQISVPSKESKEVSNLLAWVEGRDMDMGRHFLSQPKKDADLSQGVSLSGMIPICTIDVNMVWRMVLSFTYRDKLIHLHLDLNTFQHEA